MDTLCRFYLNDFFTHYILFGIIGPIVSVILIFLLRHRLNSNFWVKTSAILFFVNFIFFMASIEINGECQIRLFGEIADDPGDVGLGIITLPVFTFSMFLALIVLFLIWLKRLKLQKSGTM